MSVPALMETTPSQDEVLPSIGPNIATNETFCIAVMKYIQGDFFIPYLMQLERLFPVYDRIDDMWRNTQAWANLNVPFTQHAADIQKEKRGIGDPNQFDSRLAKVSPSAVHRQIDTIVNLDESLSFEGGNLPVQAKLPKEVFEHPMYNPSQQAVDVANAELRRQAKEIGLKTKHRIAKANLKKYGHTFILRDFERVIEPVVEEFPLSPDPMQGMAQLQMLMQQYGQQARIKDDAAGRKVACFQVPRVKTMRTNFIPLDPTATFIDELLSCRPMERQPCPIVRLHISRWDLVQNPYDPVQRPFGWLNIENAAKEGNQQYAFSAPDEESLRQRIAKRWGLSDTPGGQKVENTVKQLWTAYPLLGIDFTDPQNPKLDTGDGCPCAHCKGGKMAKPIVNDFGDEVGVEEVQCPNCGGSGKIHPKPERYVVQMYGTLYGGGGSCTCLRIQRNPTAKDKVPIIYSADLVEDTATARPVSKSEIALSAHDQLATAHNQFLDSKSMTIRRPWHVYQDSMYKDQPLNIPDGKIKHEYQDFDREFRRSEGTSYDDTATLIPYMQTEEKEVVEIFGATDIVVGEISAGRRAATEINLASEGAKRPLINFIDRTNGDLYGEFGWGQAVLDDLEVWGDRDYLLKRTGKTTFGKIELFTAVGEELLRDQDLLAQSRYFMETFAALPQLQGVIPQLAKEMMKAARVPIDLSILDQGEKKAQQDGFVILARIMGEGLDTGAQPDDPHQIYISVLGEALREMIADPNNYWRMRAPQNIPLLQQRVFQQTLLFQQQQAMQLQQQLALQQLQTEATTPPDPRGDQPARPKEHSKSPGEERQRSGS